MAVSTRQTEFHGESKSDAMQATGHLLMDKPKSVSLRIRQLRRLLGVNRQEFAGLLGFSERSVAGWEAGSPPHGPRIQRLSEFERLGATLQANVGAHQVAGWLRETREIWEGRNALQVIKAGEIDRVWKCLFSPMTEDDKLDVP